jgi:hypothetical protein
MVNGMPNTHITDAGMKELGKLISLTMLDLNHTQITDAGLKEIKQLKQLSDLELRGWQKTGAQQVKGLGSGFYEDV